MLADNKLAEQACWDRDLLALEVADLNDLGVDLGSIGFDTGEIDDPEIVAGTDSVKDTLVHCRHQFAMPVQQPFRPDHE